MGRNLFSALELNRIFTSESGVGGGGRLRQELDRAASSVHSRQKGGIGAHVISKCLHGREKAENRKGSLHEADVVADERR